MSFLLNGQPLAVDAPFTDTNGIQYPSNWLRLSSPGERSAIGIIEVPDPVYYDQRFYWGYDSDGILIPKDHHELINQWTSQTNYTAGTLLKNTDWMVIRESETGKKIPEEIKSWRNEVRISAKNKTSIIISTNSTEDLANYIASNDYILWPTAE